MDWKQIMKEARVLAGSFRTAVTLRQLHYLLATAAVGGYTNTVGCYKRLSALTAKARRYDGFPELSDRTRGIERPAYWDSTADALSAIARQYRRNRTDDQRVQSWIVYEKSTLGAQIESWLEPYGIPSTALRGYSSESLEREVFEAMRLDGRPVHVGYVGDLDPEGEDIERNFKAQAHVARLSFAVWERLAVRPDQVTAMGLVPNPGKASSSRAAGFIEEHGSLFQIEAEAVNPTELERLVTEFVTDKSRFNRSAYERLMKAEAGQRDELLRLAKARRK